MRIAVDFFLSIYTRAIKLELNVRHVTKRRAQGWDRFLEIYQRMGSFETRPSRSCARALFSPLLLYTPPLPGLELQTKVEWGVEKMKFSQRHGCGTHPYTARTIFFLTCTFDVNFNYPNVSNDQISQSLAIHSLASPVSCERHRCGITGGYPTHTNATPRSVPWRANSCPHVWSPPSTGRHVA